jgi:hypothetical protein
VRTFTLTIVLPEQSHYLLQRLAQSKQELIPMYKKLNYLASQLTPDYSPSGYMRGPLVKLTVGRLFI